MVSLQGHVTDSSLPVQHESETHDMKWDPGAICSLFSILRVIATGFVLRCRCCVVGALDSSKHNDTFSARDTCETLSNL